MNGVEVSRLVVQSCNFQSLAAVYNLFISCALPQLYYCSVKSCLLIVVLMILIILTESSYDVVMIFVLSKSCLQSSISRQFFCKKNFFPMIIAKKYLLKDIKA